MSEIQSRRLPIVLTAAGVRLDTPLRQALLILLAVAFLAGQLGWEWPAAVVWPSVTVMLVGTAVLTWRTSGWRPVVLLCLLCATFAAGRAAVQRVHVPDFPAHHLRQLALPKETVLEGWLYREPERSPTRGRLHLEAERVWRDGKPRPAAGKVRITVRHMQDDWRYGDRLRVTLKLRVPRNFHTPGSFDHVGYLARRGIYVTAFLWDDEGIERIGKSGTRPRHRIERVRRTIGAFFDAQLAPTPAAVLRALIIGDKSRIDPEVRQDFQSVGAAHVLAISGLHVGTVAFLAYQVWWWLLGRSRYLLIAWSVPKSAAILTVPVVLVYAVLAGGSVSTWRAVTMACVFLGAILLDQKEEGVRSLALAALIICSLWPGAVFDASFQLSFAAVLAILLGLHRFRAGREPVEETEAWWQQDWARRLVRPLSLFCVVSLSAMAGSLPLVAVHFHIVSFVGLLANLLVVPLLGSGVIVPGLVAAGIVSLLSRHNVRKIVVILGLIAVALLAVNVGAAAVLVKLAGWIVQAMVWLVETLAAFPYAATYIVTPTPFEIALFYGLCVTLLFFSRITPPALRKTLLVCLVGAVLIDGGYWIAQRYFRIGLRITFLDVGQGDATVVEFPGSHVMVIDGGGFLSQTFDSGEAILAPFLWQKKIGRVDTLVLTHPHLDHYGGLEFLARHFGVTAFWSNGRQSKGSRRFTELDKTLTERGIERHVLCRGAGVPRPEIGGVRIQVLHPPCGRTGLDTNNSSLVLLLSHGEVDVLLTGDVEATAEAMLLSTQGTLDSEILKVPHHGSGTSSSPRFLEAVSPDVAVASLGHLNRFDFPSPEVVERYERQDVELLRTDTAGAVTMMSDGRGYRVTITRQEGRNDR